MSLKKSKLALAVAATAGLVFSSSAMATNGIMPAGNGMAAHGTGGAGLANANEAMSGFDNPALVSGTGDSVSMGFSFFMPDRTVSQGGTEFVSDAKVFAIPQVAFTSKINDSWSWGIMANALGGMNTDYRSGPNLGLATPDNASPQSVDLSGMLISPTLSYAFNKDVSVGASLLVGYVNLRVRNLFGQESFGNAVNEGSTLAYGMKLGISAKVAEGVTLAATVQPKLSSDEFDFFKSQLQGFGFNGDAELVTPNTVGLGGKFSIGKRVDIVTDLMYYQWTSVDVFDFFGWDDQIVYKVGMEFRPSQTLALRAGVNYGESPIKGGTILPATGLDAATASYPFPAISETHVTVGLGYKMDKHMTINTYYLYSPESEETSTDGTGVAIKMTQNAFGLGFNYQSK